MARLDIIEMTGNYSSALGKVKKLLGDGLLKDAERILYDIMFSYADDSKKESGKRGAVSNSLYRLFLYVSAIEFEKEFPTACVNLKTGKMTLGVDFFIEKCKGIEDLFFLIFHERNHLLLSEITKYSYSKSLGMSFNVFNVGEDAFINASVLRFVESNLADEYYNPEETKDKGSLLSLLSSNTFGFFKYASGIKVGKKRPIVSLESLKSYVSNGKRAFGGGKNPFYYESKSVEELTCELIVMHYSMYGFVEWKSTMRNSSHTGDEKDFYDAISNVSADVTYTDWMTAFSKWNDKLPEEAKKNLEKSANVVYINVPPDMESAFGGEKEAEIDENTEIVDLGYHGEGEEAKDGEKKGAESKGEGNETKKKNGRYELTDEIREKMEKEADSKNQDGDKKTDAMKKLEKKIKKELEQKSRGGGRCGSYVTCQKFPRIDFKHKCFLEELLNDTYCEGKESFFKPDFSKERMGLTRNIKACNNIARSLISSNVLERRVSGSSVCVPPTIARKDMLNIASGYVPVFFQRHVDLARPDFAVYVDVSGSMNSYLPLVGILLSELREYATRFFQFSDVVVEQPPNKLDYYYSSGGTNFDAVADSILEEGIKNIVVVTDGCSSMTESHRSQLAKFLQNCYYIYVRDSCSSAEPNDVWSRLANHRIESVSPTYCD